MWFANEAWRFYCSRRGHLWGLRLEGRFPLSFASLRSTHVATTFQPFAIAAAAAAIIETLRVSADQVMPPSGGIFLNQSSHSGPPSNRNDGQQ